jgi:hypothetical protein
MPTVAANCRGYDVIQDAGYPTDDDFVELQFGVNEK